LFTPSKTCLPAHDLVWHECSKESPYMGIEKKTARGRKVVTERTARKPGRCAKGVALEEKGGYEGASEKSKDFPPMRTSAMMPCREVADDKKCRCKGEK